MNSFGAYARYYDLLYRDKDYAGEADYARKQLARHAPAARRLLELGCGTGAHAALLAGAGYEIHGIDQSDEMLERARARLAQLPPALGARARFERADMRGFALPQRFDAALALFHVVSYQRTNEDLCSAFRCVRQHLLPNGVFLFDCWYGPAVLTDRPAVRIRRLEDDLVGVMRLAEPVMHPNENVVDVNYEVHVRDKASGMVERFTERHRMRYLFRPEIELLAQQAGFIVLDGEEWMTGRPLGFDTWSACFALRADG
ncbi:MAG TPA: class I SAM-dependent methyltransferase [Steroidobacteraceae bacterium]|nr:class I SAM-dependent methyltransferase [Steroidobacteraceae bacterium]